MPQTCRRKRRSRPKCQVPERNIMDPFSLLRWLIAHPSPVGEEQEVIHEIGSFMTNLGYRMTSCPTQDGRVNLVAEIGSPHRTLAVYGAVDTNASGGDDQIHIRNGRIYGNGVADRKAGLAAILSLAEHVAKYGLPVTFLFGVGAHRDGAGAYSLVNHPSLRKSDAVLTVSPALEYEGAFSVLYGRVGTVELGIKVKGKDERSEKLAAAEVASWVETMKFHAVEPFGMSRVIVHTNRVIVPGDVDYDARVELLTTPRDTAEKISTFLTVVADDYGIDATVEPLPRAVPYPEAYVVDTDHRLVRLFDRNIFSARNVQRVYADTAGDENMFANHSTIPVLSLAPVGSTSSKDIEWVEEGSLYALTKSLASAADMYAAHAATYSE